MGLGTQAIDAIAREHKYKPITGDVLFVGRQTTYVTPHDLAHKLRSHALAVDEGAIEIDRTTIDRRRGYRGKELVTDRSIFRALGVASVKAIDVSPYEGAEIVHDLNRPIPPELEGVADFLVDGSTLDNVFDPAMALRNYARLLRPGGRLIAINAFNTLETAYTICTPAWYFDFFVVNAFVDCRVYVGADQGKKANTFWLDPAFYGEQQQVWKEFRTLREAATILLAEKGAASSTDKTPIQYHYRNAEQRQEFLARCRAFAASQRPHLARSISPRYHVAPPGWIFIDQEFVPELVPPPLGLGERAFYKVRRGYRRLAERMAESE